MWHTCWRCFSADWRAQHGKRVPDSVTKEKITELIELAAANFGVARGKISGGAAAARQIAETVGPAESR